MLCTVLIIKALIIPIFTFIVSSCHIPQKYKKRNRVNVLNLYGMGNWIRSIEIQ